MIFQIAPLTKTIFKMPHTSCQNRELVAMARKGRKLRQRLERYVIS